MTPAMILAIAQLLSVALSEGVKIKELLDKAKEGGALTDEQWAAIVADVKEAEAEWDAATALGSGASPQSEPPPSGP